MRTIKKFAVTILLVALLAATVRLQNIQVSKVPRFRPYRDSLYLPRQQVAHFVSLGYKMLLADLLWLRSIQAFGGHFQSDRDYRPVLHLFDTITDLDPHFIDAYTFGNMVIGEEAGDQQKGLELVDKGILHNPRTYRLPYWAGYVCVWSIHDLERAKYYYRLALKSPDCPDYVKRILSYVELKSGKYRIAYEKYVEDYLRALDENDNVITGLVHDRIIDVIRLWVVAILNDLAKKYNERHGEDITQIAQLEPLLQEKDIIIPSFDKFMQSLQEHLRVSGKLMPHLQKIIKQSFARLERIPEEPYGLVYYIKPGKTSKDDDFIADAKDIELQLRYFLSAIRRSIKDYKEFHGRYPPDKDSIFSEPLKEKEPFGGEWLYNPETGDFRSSTLPQL